jgi:hypothetical protein
LLMLIEEIIPNRPATLWVDLALYPQSRLKRLFTRMKWRIHG